MLDMHNELWQGRSIEIYDSKSIQGLIMKNVEIHEIVVKSFLINISIIFTCPVLYPLLFYIFTDPPIISTNRDWVHTGKKSTITLRCHVCAEKPYKVKLILFEAFHQHKN